MNREQILDAAKMCVNGDRDHKYGSPEHNFSRIAKYWTLYLGTDINALDVSMMMALFKVARMESGTGTMDNFVDLAGYAACAGEIYCKGENK